MPRVKLNFSDQSASQVKLDTERCVQLFQVPKGAHPAIVGLKGWEVAQGAVETFWLISDPGPHKGQDLDDAHGASVGASAIVTGDELVNSGIAFRKFLYLVVDSSDSYQAQDNPAEPIEIFDGFTMIKTENTQWELVIDYILVEGDMDWLSETGELFEGYDQVERETSAGNPFHQIGNRYKIGYREY